MVIPGGLFEGDLLRSFDARRFLRIEWIDLVFLQKLSRVPSALAGFIKIDIGQPAKPHPTFFAVDLVAIGPRCTPALCHL